VVQEEAITKEAAQEADAAAQAALKQRGALPRHIAVIMDGNGRWAKAQGRPRVAGHREGVKAVRDVTEACAELGIEYLTEAKAEEEYRAQQESDIEVRLKDLKANLHKEKATIVQRYADMAAKLNDQHTKQMKELQDFYTERKAEIMAS
jgi:undecaprenyl diphosphate synthase